MNGTRTPPLFTRPMMALAVMGLAGILAVNYLHAERHQAGLDKEAFAAKLLLKRTRAAEAPDVIASNRSATALELLQAESTEAVDPKAKKVRSMEEILLDQASLDNEAEEGFKREDKQRAEALEAAKQAAEPSDDPVPMEASSSPEAPVAAEGSPEAEEASPQEAAEAPPAEGAVSADIKEKESEIEPKSVEAPALVSTPDDGAPASSQNEPAASPPVLEPGQSL